MLTILGAEGDGTLFDLLFSRPAGLLISLFYLADVSSSGVGVTNPVDVTSLVVNYGLPLALVIYFLIRDDRREKRGIRDEAARRKEEQVTALRKEEHEKVMADALLKEERRKALELQEETRQREERMTKRLKELEDFIHVSMMTGLAESSKAVTMLATELRGFLSAMNEKQRKE
jgi:hypothetical protein